MKDLINKTTKLNLSSRKKRIAAFIIDQIILTIIMILILFLTLGTNFTIENNIEKISSMILAISITGFLLYCIKD